MAHFFSPFRGAMWANGLCNDFSKLQMAQMGLGDVEMGDR